MRKIVCLCIFIILNFGFSNASFAYQLFGYKWSGGLFNYYINPIGVDNSVDYSAKSSTIISAAAAWESVSTTNVSLNYSGTTTNTGWMVNDGNNVITWKTDGWSGNVIGLSVSWYGGGQIIDSDIKLNTAFANDARLPTLVTHEVGHSLGIGHTRESGDPYNVDEYNAIMYWMLHSQTDLNKQDKCAITAIYPSAGSCSPTFGAGFYDCLPCCSDEGFVFVNAPLNLTTNSVSTTQIDLNWTLNGNSDPVLIVWSPNNVFGTPNDGETYIAGNSIPGGGTVLYYGSGTSYIHSGLNPNTTYYYLAWSENSGIYSDSITATASTKCNDISTFPWSEDFSSTAIPQCWSINDIAGNGQIWTFDNPGNRTVNTTSNANGFAILDSDNYGNANTQNCDLISPQFDFNNSTNIAINFEHYFEAYPASSATFKYSIDNGNSWLDLQTWIVSTANPATFSQNLTNEVAGESQVLFKWNYTGTWGYYWAIDDISITADQAVADNTTLSNTTYPNGNTDCIDALQTITVAGNGNNVILEDGASITLIAGQNILLKPGFQAQNGSFLSAYITTDQSFCNQPAAMVMSSSNSYIAEKTSIQQIDADHSTEPKLQVFPNPNNGRFTIALKNFHAGAKIMIYNSVGALIHQESTFNESTTVELPETQLGIYFVKVLDGIVQFNQKIVIQ